MDPTNDAIIAALGARGGAPPQPSAAVPPRPEGAFSEPELSMMGYLPVSAPQDPENPVNQDQLGKWFFAPPGMDSGLSDDRGGGLGSLNPNTERPGFQGTVGGPWFTPNQLGPQPDTDISTLAAQDLIPISRPEQPAEGIGPFYNMGTVTPTWYVNKQPPKYRLPQAFADLVGSLGRR